MRISGQKICLWSGYGFFVLYLIGIVIVAGFIPPPSPHWGGGEIASYFSDRHTRILIGMSICAFASPLYVSWGVAMLGQMVRMERPRFPALSLLQGISSGAGGVFFAISPFLWLTIAFRQDHAPDTVRMLNDFAWISWIVSWPFFAVQAAAFGLCVLMSGNTSVPRWVAYLSFWFAISMFPASAIVFFTSGPLAWNGVLGLYLPLSVFAIWFNVVTYWVGRSINNDATEMSSDPSSPSSWSAVDRSASVPEVELA
jgi:hypothetical protein